MSINSNPAHRAAADTTRSQIVLEIAAALVAQPQQRLRQAKVSLREQGSAEGWPLCLFASSTHEGIDAVVSGEAALAIVNPSAALTLAYRGTGAYAQPQPVRSIAVVPTRDELVLAANAATGLQCFEDIAARRVPLRIGVRGQHDHYLHVMLEHVAQAAGFSFAELRAWGGDVRPAGLRPPGPDGPLFAALAAGEIDAIFDEAADRWLDAALERGMTVLSLAEPTVQRLESRGYRRAMLRGTLTLDFSGWAIFVRADLEAELVTQICAALDARKALIAWDGVGPLPVERMCRDAPDTPLDVPLHSAAERYWRECGYLPAPT